jgi:IS30 family transposase
MKVIRNGVQVRFVPPLDRLQLRQISARYLSQEERIRIADLQKAGLGVRQIAARLGRAPSTISRELRRKVFDSDGYAPFDAHQHAVLKRARHHRRRVETNSDLRQVVVDLLAQRWSPQQISRHLYAQFPDQPPMRLCHESIISSSVRQGGRSCDRQCWRRSFGRRVARVVTTDEHTTWPNAAGRGSCNRC